MPNGLLGTRGSQLGNILLGWVAGGDDYIRAVGNPTLYYSFDEPIGSTNAADLSGARPGIYSGTTTLKELGPSYASGYLQSGASLNSTTTPLNVATGSISFWARLDTLPTSPQLLLGFIDSASSYDKAFYIDSTGTLTFTIFDTTRKNLTFSNFITSAHWNHFVATFNGTTAILYVNGVQAATLAVGSSYSSYSTNNLWIGSGSTSPANAVFPGTISGHYDEVAIWNNLILTPEQVLGLYTVSLQYITQSNAVITQQAIEVLQSGSPVVQITNEKVEVAYNKNPSGLVTSYTLEVVRQVSDNNYIPLTYEFTLSSNLSITQTINVQAVKTYNLTLSNSLTTTQTLNLISPRQISFVSNAYVSQDITFRKNITFQITVTNNFAASQNLIIRNQVITINMNSNLTASQRIRTERTLTWISGLSVSQNYPVYKITTQKLIDTLAITQHFTSQKTINQTLIARLTPLESYSTKGSTHNVSLNDFEILTSGLTGVLIVKDLASHPVVTGVTVINGLYTTILGNDGFITLPAAEYGDTLAAKIVVDVKRSMTGKTYTYVKTNPNDKFSFTFILGIQKAYELKMFCISNFNQKVYLQLWDGRQYTANIISENIPLTFEGKWQGVDREKVSVTVDFEGFRTL